MQDLTTQEAKPDNAASISRTVAQWAAAVTHGEVPRRLLDFARFHLLDVVGVSLAASRFDFAHRAFSGLSTLNDGGASTVLGFGRSLGLKDAALMNGVLAHGLDYDDTHPGGPVHPSASAFPCALAMAEHLDRSGKDLLTAYLIGVEISTRLGIATNGAIHRAGFHPTGVAGHMGCAMAAGHLLGLNSQQLEYAQGLAGSTASAIAEHRADGAWNKRMHAGWAAAGGITAASLARAGFIGTRKVYEGEDGLFRTHAGAHLPSVLPQAMTDGLGETWRSEEVSIKPYPVCHILHASIDSVRALRRAHGLREEDVAGIEALLHPNTFHAVCDFPELRRRPPSDYVAKFSVYYTLAAGFLHDRCGFAELEPEALSDPRTLAIAERVSYTEDKESAYPTYFSGGAVITLKDGRRLKHVERVSRGAGDRALSEDDIVTKFLENAELSMAPSRARALCESVLDIERMDAREFARTLAGM